MMVMPRSPPVRKPLLLVDPEGIVRTRDRTVDSVSHLIDFHRDTINSTHARFVYGFSPYMCKIPESIFNTVCEKVSTVVPLASAPFSGLRIVLFTERTNTNS